MEPLVEPPVELAPEEPLVLLLAVVGEPLLPLAEPVVVVVLAPVEPLLAVVPVVVVPVDDVELLEELLLPLQPAEASATAREKTRARSFIVRAPVEKNVALICLGTTQIKRGLRDKQVTQRTYRNE